MRHHVVVADGRDDGDQESIVMVRCVLSPFVTEYLDEFVGQIPILIQNLLFRPGNPLVVGMSGGVSGPDHKIDRVPKVAIDPFEGLVDEREGRIAVRCLGAVEPCWTESSMACCIFFGGGVDLVKWVRMEVLNMDRVLLSDLISCEYNYIPVMCKNLPWSFCGRCR